MKFKISFRFDRKQLNSINWRPFWVGLIAGIIMSIIISISTYLLPANTKPDIRKANVFDNIWQKLQKKPNNYKLNKETYFIPIAYAAFYPDKVNSYIVVDFDTGKVLEEKSISKKLPIASLTKLMTAVVALDLAKPEDVFSVTQTASNQIPTKLGLIPYEKLTLKELLEASLMTSANDATQVIKDGINKKYGINIFIEAMNKKAKFIGLKNTHFTNPQGFDNPKNYSSAEDLAILSHYAISNYPLVADTVKKDYLLLQANQYHRQFDLYNWNGLLDVYPNTIGVKIGNTDKAGTTSAVLSERNGKKILVVILGATNILNRDLIAAQLLDLGFQKVANLQPVNITVQELQSKYATWN